MAERDARLDPGRRTADEFARLGMLQALFTKGTPVYLVRQML